jgi:cbb3-type cytochrome oxidase maturation protein
LTGLLILIPVALFLGALGLLAFLWSLRSGQYEDLDGAAARILHDEEPFRGRGGPPSPSGATIAAERPDQLSPPLTQRKATPAPPDQ